MTREEVYDRLTEVFCDVFDDDNIEINDESAVNDIDGWDSFVHITLMGTIEDEFDIKFSMKDVVGTENVGQIVDLILKQI